MRCSISVLFVVAVFCLSSLPAGESAVASNIAKIAQGSVGLAFDAFSGISSAVRMTGGAIRGTGRLTGGAVRGTTQLAGTAASRSVRGAMTTGRFAGNVSKNTVGLSMLGVGKGLSALGNGLQSGGNGVRNFNTGRAANTAYNAVTK